MHLVTDYLFYNYYLDELKKPEIFDDYDIITKPIVEKYNVDLPQKVKEITTFKTGKTKILSLELAYRVIDEVSDLNLEDVEKEVMNDLDKWNYYKRLV